VRLFSYLNFVVLLCVRIDKQKKDKISRSKERLIAKEIQNDVFILKFSGISSRISVIPLTSLLNSTSKLVYSTILLFRLSPSQIKKV
jgi:hypothetical protein